MTESIKAPANESTQDVCVRLAGTMEALLVLIEEEAELIRAGKLFAIAELKDREAVLVARYGTDLRWLEANAERVERQEPRVMQWIRRRHDAFRSIMRINLAAIATARALAEMRLQQVNDRVRPPVAARDRVEPASIAA